MIGHVLDLAAEQDERVPTTGAPAVARASGGCPGKLDLTGACRAAMTNLGLGATGSGVGTGAAIETVGLKLLHGGTPVRGDAFDPHSPLMWR